MKCPYEGIECPRCIDKCELDEHRMRAPTGGIVLNLCGVVFNCACGAVIPAPVVPCSTEGCKYYVTQE